MPRFEKTLQVSAPVERAWEVIGDLTLMGRLAGATEVKVEEMTRVCTFPGGAVQHERISDYSPDHRAYSYAIEDGPLPIKNNQGSFAVQPAGDASAIVWQAEYLLRKLLHCERCGARMHGTRGSRGKVRRYQCSTHRYGGSCDQPIASAETLEAELVEWVRDFRPDEDLRALALACRARLSTDSGVVGADGEQ